MSSLHQEYISIGGNEVRLAIYFNRSKTNWATNEPMKIGYNINAVPVKRTKHKGYSMEESTCFSGFNDCLLEVERQSSKRLKTAIAELQTKKEQYIKYFEQRYDWKQTDEEKINTLSKSPQQSCGNQKINV